MPYSTIWRRVDIFSDRNNGTVVCDCYRLTESLDLKLSHSYDRSDSFLATIKYYRSHGYRIVPKSFRSSTIIGGPYVQLERGMHGLEPDPSLELALDLLGW
jgi:hypothetical protein